MINLPLLLSQADLYQAGVINATNNTESSTHTPYLGMLLGGLLIGVAGSVMIDQDTKDGLNKSALGKFTTPAFFAALGGALGGIIETALRN